MPVPKPKEPAVGSRSEKGRASSEWVEEGGKRDGLRLIEMEKPRWATLHSFISRRTEGHGVIQGDQSWEDADL